MSPKNAVAAERRMDLASLFCMIGRHGPAVALAIIAVVSVLAGFIIYRTVRGKRRKATYAAAESDSKSPGEDGDAPLIETEQESVRSHAESTDVSDNGSPDVKEDAGQIMSDLKIRHRRTAVDKKPPPYCPPKSFSLPGNTDNAPAVHDCYKEAKTYTEEASQSPESDTQMDVKEDHQGGLKDDGIMDAEEDHDSCVTAGLVYDESHKEEVKVLQAKYLGSENVTADKGVSDEKTNQVEGNIECVSSSPVGFEQNDHMRDENRDDRPQDPETTPDKNDTESNLEQPVIPIEDVCHDKENIDRLENIDYSDFCSSNRLSPGEETNHDQDQCDDVKDEAMLLIQEGEWDNKCGRISEVTEEDEGQLNNLTVVEFDAQLQQINTQQLQPEQHNENGHTCNSEDGVVNGKMLTSCGEETVAPSVVLAPPLLEKTDNGCDSQFDTTADAKPEIQGTVAQSEMKEEDNAATLDTGTGLNILIPDPSSLKEEFGSETVAAEEIQGTVAQSEMKEDDDAATLDTGTGLNILIPDPSSLKEEFGSETAAAEESVDHLLYSCYKDQQSNCMESNERLNSTPDVPVSDEAGFTALVISTDLHDHTLPSLQDKQSNQLQNIADFPEVTTTDTADVTESIKPQMCHIHLPSFEQTELTWSSSGLGEESGISSMTVSPDLQDAGDEFDMTPEKVVLPLMDCSPQSEIPSEIHDSLFADDVPVSVINEDSVGVAFGPCTSGLSQQPLSENTDLVNDKSFMSNEDIFGHAIEDRYHKEMDQFIVQMVDNDTALTDELKKETDKKAVDEVVEIKEQVKTQSDVKTAVMVAEIKEKKEGTEKEEEEEFEKTEISIMEATMDNNEWITDGNYQVLPWMNLSVPAFAQDQAKPDQLPTEEQQNSSSLSDVPCKDVPPKAEVRQTDSLSTVDESTESNKKVVAVQPMPQNVSVTFRIHYLTQSPYQKVAITGNQQELGNWKEFIPLERDKDGHWATVVSLPAESHVEWKFIVVDKGEVCRWEECGNRLLDTGYGDELLVHKWWGTL